MEHKDYLPNPPPIRSYRDIQHAFDAELKENSEWSVFLLPKAMAYYNSYVPPALSPYLSRDMVLQHLVNLTFIYEQDVVETSTVIRLMLQHRHFHSIESSDEWASLVQKAIEEHLDIGFEPNAVAKSLRNPYYRYETRDKEARNAVRREHRRRLRVLHNVNNNIAGVTEMLEDYDLSDGLLTKKKIQDAVGISRHQLGLVFQESEEINEMYSIIRNASITSKYYKKS